jgi:hypothetical protein
MDWYLILREIGKQQFCYLRKNMVIIKFILFILYFIISRKKTRVIKNSKKKEMPFSYILITKKFDLVLTVPFNKRSSIKVLFNLYFFKKNRPILKKFFEFKLIFLLSNQLNADFRLKWIYWDLYNVFRYFQFKKEIVNTWDFFLTYNFHIYKHNVFMWC